MKKSTVKMIFASIAVVAIIGLSATMTMDKKGAEAKRIVLKNDGLYTISETLGEKKIINDSNIKIILGRQTGKILYGKGLVGDALPIQDNSTNIWIMDEDGTNQKQITTEANVVYAVFAPNGQIFYTTKDQDLFSVDLTTNSSPRKVQEKVLSPDISPDSNHVVYQKLNSEWKFGQYYDQALGLTILDLQTGEEKRISTNWEDFNPLWLPNDKKILFFSRSPEGIASHFIINANGSNRKQLTNIGKKFVDQTTVAIPGEKPIISANGKYIVYESDREIWVNEFTSDNNSLASAKRAGYGRDPEWITNGETFTIISTPRDNSSNSAVMEFDVRGNYRKTL